MIASASIPAGFPPVMIDVDAGGKRYQEMHVDGGIVAQVFAYPATLSATNMQLTTGVTRERRLYVIRNARLDAEWAQTERQTMSIAARAVTSLIQSQGVGDLYRIYATAQRDGVDFNLAFIPPTFNAPHEEEFDNSYMRALYGLGEDLAVKGYPWQKTPPGFDMSVSSAPAATE
jgi:predicted acylesterase/phospholipase RssA